MATISRFNRFTPRDYSMDYYLPQEFIPNFEAWDELLAGQQQKYDAVVAIRNKYPKYLPGREAFAQQYKQQVDTSVDDITNTYVDQGVSAGNRKMRDFGNEVNRQWQAGGLAYELEQELVDYQAAVTKIDDYYKAQKAENSANRQFSLSRLQQSTQNGFAQDPTTGLYKRSAIQPDLRPYVDISEEAMKVVKDIKGSGTTDIVKLSPYWFEKIQREDVVTPETIKAVTDALLQQPKYQEQLAIETWQAKQGMAPEQLAILTQQEQDRISKTVTDALGKVDAMATSKNVGDVKRIQEQLKDLGYYTGAVDGKFGQQSKDALQRYKEDIEKKKQDRLSKVNPDNILEQQIVDNYTRPLVAAYSRETVKKDLIYNRQQDLQARLAAQRRQTADLVTAVQSLRDPETNQFLVSPGGARPMENLESMRKKGQEVYTQAKATFDQIAGMSGVSMMIGTNAPNKVHEVTNARLQSRTPQEFASKVGQLGITDPKKVTDLWNFYSSPGASSLNDAYLAMQQAKQPLDDMARTEVEITRSYLTTSPQGKKEALSLRKRVGAVSDDELAQMIVNDDPRLALTAKEKGTGQGYPTTFAGQSAIQSDQQEALFGISSVKRNRDNYLSENPNLFPESLRGYAFNAIKGEGSDLEKVIIDDIRSGYTNGYSSEGQSGIVFRRVTDDGRGDKVSLQNVNLDNADLRFNVDAGGVTYYITGKDKEGKPVSAIVDAPQSHVPRLRTMSLVMKKEATQTSDGVSDALANQLYAVTSYGPRYNNAVEDALTLTNANTHNLNEVIDPFRSSKGNLRTFGENSNVRGTAIGQTISANGYEYQKFKVTDNTQGTGYILGVKTEQGYVPVLNSDGGLYYRTSQEAESPIWNAEMMNQIPVEINQQKVKQTNVTPEEARVLMLGLNTALESTNSDNEMDNNGENSDNG